MTAIEDRPEKMASAMMIKEPIANASRAIQLSAEKYCSASAMLGKTAEITQDFEVVERGGAD